MARILVINPNTTESMTRKIEAAARAVAAPETAVTAVNPESGPVSIEGAYDEALAVPGLIDELRKGIDVGFDGFVVACFDDPGLPAARTLTDRPVVGICEAAMHMVALVATRFTVIVTMKRSLATAAELARRYGVSERCRIRWIDVAVLDLENPSSDAGRIVREEARRAIVEDEAEAVLLGCAGMADLSRSLTEEFGVPVIDGVAAGVTLVEAMIHLGLRTSKVGAYATPLSKTYCGKLAHYAPGERPE